MYFNIACRLKIRVREMVNAARTEAPEGEARHSNAVINPEVDNGKTPTMRALHTADDASVTEGRPPDTQEDLVNLYEENESKSTKTEAWQIVE